MVTDVLIGLAAAWLLTGVITGFVMKRQGHDFFVWLALGSVLGPLIVPLAVDNARSIRVAKRAARRRSGPPAGGLDLLIALDGSPEALTAARTATGMLGPGATSVTLATVLDFEAETSETGAQVREEAQALLDEVASSIDFPSVDTRILFGRPDTALTEYARISGAEMIVVGPRGRGATQTLFGSVTKNLVTAGAIPVFVGPRAVESSPPQMVPD